MKIAIPSVNGLAKTRLTEALGRSFSQPQLSVHTGRRNPRVINPATMGSADWDQLHDLCNKTTKEIVFEVVALSQWPEETRYPFLSMCRDLGSRCHLEIGGSTFDDPFDAVLAAMVGLQAMDAHRQSFRAAVEAAALFHGDMPAAAAKRINDRLAEVGGMKLNHPSLAKQIRQLAGQPGSEGAVDAHAAAKLFLEHIAEASGVAEGHPVLRYFQSDFFVWQRKAYRRTEDENFEAEVMNYLQKLAIPKLNERFAKDVIAHLKGITNLSRWDEPMPFLVVTEAPLKIERPHLVVFNNGMVDLDELISGKVKEARPISSDYFNEVVLPYDFDVKAKCPLWIDTLAGILPKQGKDDNRQAVIQEFMGYSVSPDCRFQKMLAAIGEGGNGKTTVMKIWQAMLGNANFSSVPLEVLGNEHRQFSLRGKLANFSAEFPYLREVNEGMLKSIVSGEDIEVNRKFKPPVKIRPHAKLIVHSNEMPQIRDPTEGTWDRIIAVPFEERIRDTKKDDKGRLNNLMAELPGIFNWAIEGLRRLLKQGHFTACAKCSEFLGQHRTESDTVRLFVSDCLQKEKDWVTFSVPLYQLYRFYCESTGRKPVADSEFGKRMQRLKWKKEREKGGKRRLYYRDMALSRIGSTYRDGVSDKASWGGPICRHITQMND